MNVNTVIYILCNVYNIYTQLQRTTCTSNDNINEEGSQGLCNCHEESKPMVC